ncbi:hypothetical protein [Nocardia sp. NBC_01388]|uniref:hypothetical protein n=1 Tax=Nocardia sp. NBC_01388 TaxID=2903596 RepID=UPI00324ECCDA
MRLASARVALFGALVNSRIGRTDHPAPQDLSPAIRLVFLGVAAMAVVMIAAVATMPRN